MSVFKVEARSGSGWEIIGSATRRDDAENIVDERVGRSDAGWLVVESGGTRVWMRKDAVARITETHSTPPAGGEPTP